MTEQLTYGTPAGNTKWGPGLVPFLTSYAGLAFGIDYKAHLGSPALTSAAWPTVNLALYVPFAMYQTRTVKRFFWANGTTSSTHKFQVAVYTMAGTAIKIGTQTTASGTSAPQFDNIADFVLYPGTYYMAIHGSGTTPHLLQNAVALRALKSLGIRQESSLASGLQATANFATAAGLYLPLFGLDFRGTP